MQTTYQTTAPEVVYRDVAKGAKWNVTHNSENNYTINISGNKKDLLTYKHGILGKFRKKENRKEVVKTKIMKHLTKNVYNKYPESANKVGITYDIIGSNYSNEQINEMHNKALKDYTNRFNAYDGWFAFCAGFGIAFIPLIGWLSLIPFVGAIESGWASYDKTKKDEKKYSKLRIE